MPFVAVPNTAQVNVIQELDLQKIENVFHVQNTSGTGLPDLGAIASLFGSWWETDLSPEVSHDLILTEVVATDISQEGGTQEAWTPTGIVTGGNSSGSTPNNVALCISLRSVQRGRSYRGRSYLAGLPETSVNKSRLDPSFVTAFVSSYNGLIVDLADAGFRLVVVSRFHNKLPRIVPITTPIVLALAVDNVVDSQRRRLPGRGV
jgi:hypothetical protein